MTEEKLIELVRNKHKGNGLATFIALSIIALIAFWLTGVPYVLGLIGGGIYYGIKIHNDEKEYIKNPKSDILFLIYDNIDTLIKVMDEIIYHPIYKTSKAKISKHFILYGDEYENIIRLYDVTGINITKLNDVYSRIDIEDRFDQKKKIKVETPKAEDIYKYLSENCKNAKIDYMIAFTESDNDKKYIDYGKVLDEEYCFYEGETKKENKKRNKVVEDKKIDKKEEVKSKKIVKKNTTTKNEVKSKKETSNMDQKYNDLKKLKELLDNDILTKEEYEKEKNKILSN